MKKLATLTLILMLATAQGCYMFEEAIIEIFPHDRIAKYYLSNLVSAPDRDSEDSRKVRAEKDFKQFMENWDHNIEEVIFEASIDSVLYKELTIVHKKLNASVIVRYKKMNDLTDTIKPGYYLFKIDSGDPIEHNGTEIMIDSTKYAEWPEDTEKIVLKFRNISSKNIHRKRKFIRLGKLYSESLKKKH